MKTLISQAADLDKDQLQAEGKAAALEMIEDGYNDAAPLIINARKAIEYLNAFSRALESKAEDEILMQDTKEIKAYRSTISLGSTGDRLNYKGDPVWSALKAQLQAREALLKIARKEVIEVKDGDGNLVPKVSLASASKTVIRVKL